MPRAFDRDAALSVELETDKDDAIQQMLVLGENLYVFSTKKIFRVRTADDVDPDRTNPDTRHSYQEVYPIGCSNPFVARSVVQAKQIFDGLILQSELDRKRLLDAVWEATQLLLQCENARSRISNDIMSLIEDVDNVVERSKSQTVIPSLPQVADLEERVSSFLGCAKRFLEKAHFLLCMFYESPDHAANFKAYCEWMSANRSSSDEVVNLLSQDQEWIRFISESRNALAINHARPNFVLEVRNFTLDAGNRFSAPTWRYDLSKRGGSVQDYWSDIAKDMDTHLHNMLTFFEELYILCALDNRNERLPLECGVYRLPDDRVKVECPVRYVAQATLRVR